MLFRGVNSNTKGDIYQYPCDKRTMDLLTLKKTERIWLLYNWSGFISPVFFWDTETYTNRQTSTYSSTAYLSFELWETLSLL